MDAKEGRIILLGMVLGAAAGGAAVMLLRMRSSTAGQQSIRQAMNDISWAEIVKIGVAAIALARRVAALSEPVAESAADEQTA
jgi:gas vesicle protein